MPQVLNDTGTQIVADRVSIPVGGGEAALDAIWGRGTDVFGDLPAILAFAGAEECAQVVIGLLAGFGAAKVLGDALMEGR